MTLSAATPCHAFWSCTHTRASLCRDMAATWLLWEVFRRHSRCSWWSCSGSALPIGITLYLTCDRLCHSGTLMCPTVWVASTARCWVCFSRFYWHCHTGKVPPVKSREAHQHRRCCVHVLHHHDESSTGIRQYISITTASARALVRNLT